MRSVSLFRRLVKLIGLILLSILISAVIILGTVIGVSYLQNREFKETFYEVTSNKVEEGLRIIQISDLHAVHYDHLVSRIQELKPDLIVLTGDIVDCHTQDDSAVVATCGQLAQTAPTYYIYGNHERERQFGSDMLKEDVARLAQKHGVEEEELVFSALPDPLREKMEAAGVDVLMNEQATLQVRNTTVDIYGVLTTSSSGFYKYAENSFYPYAYGDEDHVKLMLIHEPYLMDIVTVEDWGDLILCGHTHGGVARLPFIGGVYEDAHGIFPEFLSDGKVMGQYSVQGIPMIISSGLSNLDIWRINNQPELVIVDINRY